MSAIGLAEAAWKYFRAHPEWIIATVLLGLLGLYEAAKSYMPWSAL
jgi:hypothetical protein